MRFARRFVGVLVCGSVVQSAVQSVAFPARSARKRATVKAALRSLRKRRRAMRREASTRVGGCDARGGRRDAVGGSSRREERGALGDGDDAEVVSPGRGGRGSKASTGSPRGRSFERRGRGPRGRRRRTATRGRTPDEARGPPGECPRARTRRRGRGPTRGSETRSNPRARRGTEHHPRPVGGARRATAPTPPGGRRAWTVQNVEATVVIARASRRSGAARVPTVRLS